ncbi:hypothetical protein AURDEDRAFT_168977 [Auricularia subglabra TFB-10046 SS5]|nr:hypothetical protein AURDEDRAFT_168977 [Auricularia subglabra TFB-10046 SS5]
MSRARSARAAHLSAEIAALETLDVRIADLQREHAKALEDLQLAQRRADAVAAQKADLEHRRHTAVGGVRVARAAYMQNVLDACPEDVLHLIFEATAELPDENWQTFGFGAYNHRRSKSPFHLASICSRWRRIALGCPSLWTYCALPSKWMPSLELARIDILLARSCSRPLEILIARPWGKYTILEDGQDNGFVQCFDRLRLHSHRWGKAEIWMPKASNLRLFDAFRSRLPLLSELSLTAHTPDEPPPEVHPRGSYLSFAPRLRNLDLAFWAMKVSTLTETSLPALSHLRLWTNCPAEVSARLVSLCRGTLEYLDVASSDQVQPTAPLTLPRLHTLSLRSEPFFASWTQPGMLSFPNLTTLCLSSSAISATLARGHHNLIPRHHAVLVHLVPKVTHLALCGDIALELLDTVKHLSRITHLAFVQPTPEETCMIEDEFFLQLADATPPIWPNLRGLELSSAVSVTPSHGEGILHLLLKRNLERNPGEANAVCRIENVSLDFCDAPVWLSIEVARLLDGSAS